MSLFFEFSSTAPYKSPYNSIPNGNLLVAQTGFFGYSVTKGILAVGWAPSGSMPVATAAAAKLPRHNLFSGLLHVASDPLAFRSDGFARSRQPSNIVDTVERSGLCFGNFLLAPVEDFIGL